MRKKKSTPENFMVELKTMPRGETEIKARNQNMVGIGLNRSPLRPHHLWHKGMGTLRHHKHWSKQRHGEFLPAKLLTREEKRFS